MEITMAGTGGRREGAGRKPGSRNKVTTAEKRTLREIADAYTSEAIETLARIMRDGKAPAAARATAANSILDRAHGKARQPVDHDLDLSKLTDEQVIALALALGANPAAFESDGGDPASPSTH